MGVKILNYVLMFFLFSMVGWTVESTYRSLGETYRARKTTKEKMHVSYVKKGLHFILRIVSVLPKIF